MSENLKVQQATLNGMLKDGKLTGSGGQSEALNLAKRIENFLLNNAQSTVASELLAIFDFEPVGGHPESEKGTAPIDRAYTRKWLKANLEAKKDVAQVELDRLEREDHPYLDRMRAVESAIEKSRNLSIAESRTAFIKRAEKKSISVDDAFYSSYTIFGDEDDARFFMQFIRDPNLAADTGLRLQFHNLRTAKLISDNLPGQSDFLDSYGDIIESCPYPLFPPRVEFIELNIQMLAEVKAPSKVAGGGGPARPSVFEQKAGDGIIEIEGGAIYFPCVADDHGNYHVDMQPVDDRMNRQDVRMDKFGQGLEDVEKTQAKTQRAARNKAKRDKQKQKRNAELRQAAQAIAKAQAATPRGGASARSSTPAPPRGGATDGDTKSVTLSRQEGELLQSALKKMGF